VQLVLGSSRPVLPISIGVGLQGVQRRGAVLPVNIYTGKLLRNKLFEAKYGGGSVFPA
jgi:hypothetical protein